MPAQRLETASADTKSLKMGSFSSTPPSPRDSVGTISASSTHSNRPSSTNMTEPSMDHDMCIGNDEARMQKSPDSLETVAVEAKRLTQLVARIRELGVEEAGELALPKLCVVGGQSTGKSSLIEAISEIRVPRADDTCTRCPLEIILTESASPNGPWECKVSLVRKYSYDNINRGARTKRGALGPWNELRPVETTDFAILHNKSDVEDVLRRAQLATLNPGRSPEVYKSCSEQNIEDNPALTFSPNVIRLNICGPGLPNLCFYDLPGIIEQGEHESDVFLVKNLVKEYISDPSCVVLDTMAMNTDIQNASSGALIDKLKAGPRTIGVLTKPDCISQGQSSFKQWNDALKGHRFKRKWGYFVVKNSQDTSIDHATAREEEQEFFRTQRPFSTELRDHQHRFGITALKDFLSSVLVDQIRQSLAPLTERIRAKIQEMSIELEKLPKPMEGNVSLQVHTKMKDFMDILKRELQGGSREHKCFAEWYERAMKFSNLIVGSYPTLSFPYMPLTGHVTPRKRPLRSDSVTPSREPQEIIDLSDDDGEPPNKKLKFNNLVKAAFQPKDPSVSAPNEARSNSTKWEIRQIKQLKDSLNKGLPGARDIQVTGTIFKESIKHWEGLLVQFLKETKHEFGLIVDHHLWEVFGQWDKTEMLDLILNTEAEFRKTIFARQRVTAGKHLETEANTILTFNTQAKETLERTDREFLEQNARGARFRQEMEKRKGADQMVPPVIMNEVKEDIKNGPVEFGAEIEEIAAARAYYNIAARRFTDNICLCTRTEIFMEYEQELQNTFNEHIGLLQDDANARCRDLLELDRETLSRRNDLTRKLKALEESLQTIKRESMQTTLAHRGLHDLPQ